MASPFEMETEGFADSDHLKKGNTPMTYGKPRTPAALRALLAGDEKNFAVAQIPGGIEAQEALAQQDLIKSQKLPKEGTVEPGYHEKENNKANLEALGFVFGQDVDDLFVVCTFPKGWIVPGHNSWPNE